MRPFTALELPDEPRKHLSRIIQFWKQKTSREGTS